MSDLVRKKIPVAEMLAGLAEEAAELAQAALKLRRVLDGTNPTIVSEQDAIDHLYEEIADVYLYIETIDINPNSVRKIMEMKRERWESRLNRRDSDA